MRILADWFIHGEVDWEVLEEHARRWGPILAGAFFGAAWWVWADSIVYERVHGAASPPFKYALPGIVATIALVLINVISRNELAEISSSGDEATDTRARVWLFFSFLLAMAAVGGSIAVLITCTTAEAFVAVGVGSVFQCGLILASALLFWAFRLDESSSPGYGFL